jgi:hypothetical protein
MCVYCTCLPSPANVVCVAAQQYIVVLPQHSPNGSYLAVNSDHSASSSGSSADGLVAKSHKPLKPRLRTEPAPLFFKPPFLNSWRYKPALAAAVVVLRSALCKEA